MELVLPTLLLVIAGGVGMRLWLRSWQERRIAARRRIEAPGSAYSSLDVRYLEDRARWERIGVASLHPLNREEVVRLLEMVDSEGVGVLSASERLFLDNMALPRTSM